MFESGFSREAREKLIEIARKDIVNGGLFEWDTKDGAGRGSDFYSGSAGSLARALIEGYLGSGSRGFASRSHPGSAWTRPGSISTYRLPAVS